MKIPAPHVMWHTLLVRQYDIKMDLKTIFLLKLLAQPIICRACNQSLCFWG